MIVSPRGQRVVRLSVAIGALAVAALAISDHIRLVHIARTSSNYASQPDVRALKQRFGEVDTALARLQHAPVNVTQATFDATRQTLDARLSKVEQLANAAANTDAVNALDARVRQLETHIAATTQATNRATPFRHRRPTTPTPRIPPFVILGEEQRGGETFLTIAPPHLHALGDVHLLQPGDSEGDWQLEALDGRTATFRIDGQTQHLPIH